MDSPVGHGTDRRTCVLQTSPLVGASSPEFWKADRRRLAGARTRLHSGWPFGGADSRRKDGGVLGEQNLAFGILAGWGIGLLVPGGPYLIFPIVANLLRQGAAPGPLIALITAKVLLSPIRVFSYEAPLLGWPMTFARLVPGLLLPPALGWIGQWLFEFFNRKW